MSSTLPSIDSGALAQYLAEAGQALESAGDAEATLAEVCEQAVAVVARCSCAGVTESRQGEIGQVLMASDPVAQALLQAQYEIGEGPCVTSLWSRRIVWENDLRQLETGWPTFAGKAVARGIHSLLSIQLYTDTDVVGVLTLFSEHAGAFDEVTRDVAQIYAAQAALASAAARHDAQFSQALTTRQRIGQATGILAERHHITTDQAFTLLSTSSQRLNIKLRDLADQLVTTEDAARRRRPSRTGADRYSFTQAPGEWSGTARSANRP